MSTAASAEAHYECAERQTPWNCRQDTMGAQALLLRKARLAALAKSTNASLAQGAAQHLNVRTKTDMAKCVIRDGFAYIEHELTSTVGYCHGEGKEAQQAREQVPALQGLLQHGHLELVSEGDIAATQKQRKQAAVELDGADC